MNTLPEAWRRGLPPGWAWTKLTRVALLGTGHTPDRSRPDYWEDCTIPWVTAADLSQRSSAFEPLMETAQHVSPLGVANSAAVVHPAGTVMFCRTASVGLFCITGRPMATTQAFVTWTPGPKVEGRFLLYVIAGMATEFDRLAYGSTHMTVYMPDLEDVRIPLPPLVEQRRIVDFLDDQIGRLEWLSQQRARQAVLLDEVEEGLLPELLRRRGVALPDTLEGPVAPLPSGWRVGELGHLLREFTNGFVGPTRDILVEDGVRYIQSLHIKQGNINFDRRPFYVTEEWHRQRPRIHLRQGDVLIVQTGDVGQVAVVPADFGEASCHALQIARVEPDVISGVYLGEYLRSTFGRAQLLARATGALHPHLEAGIKNTPVVVPPMHIQQELVDEMDRGREEVTSLRRSLSDMVRLLGEFKASLISAAVSGQIDVTTAHGAPVRL